MRMLLRVIIVAWVAWEGHTAKISALRLGSDSTSNDFSLAYAEQYKQYMLEVSASADYVRFSTPFAFCFRLRPVTTSDSSCSLSNDTGSYDCLGIQTTWVADNVTGTFWKWTLSSDFTTITGKTAFTPAITVIESDSDIISLSMNGTFGGSGFSFVGKGNSIFQVVSAGTFYFYGNETKVNYINTFPQGYLDNSDDLLMQRQVQCFLYGDIVNLLFLGAVSRSQTSYYMVAFINYHLTGTSFLMWQGLSFSKDKVLRDMLGVVPSSGTFSDLYSLYAAAPFADTSINVNGTEDWTMLASSDNLLSGSAGTFYYTQLYRQFDTGDTKGDEVIMYKINNQYCFAAYFTDGSSVSSYTDNSAMHNMLQCFTPDLTLAQIHSQLLLALLLLMLPI